MAERDLSSKLFAAAREVIPGGVNSPVRAFRSVDGDPFFIQRARGCRIWDVDGNEMIDYIGTWGPAILGHAPSVVIDAVSHAAKEGVSFGIPNRHEVEIARMIRDFVPSVEKVRMVNSGTEATMTAIRLARGVRSPSTRQRRILCRNQVRRPRHDRGVETGTPCRRKPDPCQQYLPGIRRYGASRYLLCQH